MPAEQAVTTLEAAYHQLNRSYDRPLVFFLSNRGFFSEVTNLITAMVLALVEKRRLVVGQARFNGYRWQDFFQTALPDAEGERLVVNDQSAIIQGIYSPAFTEMRDWLTGLWNRGATLDLPEIGVSGSVFDVKRALNGAFCIPRRQMRRDAHREMKRLGLVPGQFAALHVRRGDKIRPESGVPEGQATTPAAYVDAIRAHVPGAKDIFVLTDDFPFLQLLREADRSLRFHTLCPPEQRGHHQFDFNARPVAKKREEINRLLTEVEIATVSSAFLGGFQSNVARHITTVHAHPEDCHSVDNLKTWAPF
jgi:hypothetical protein